MNLTKLPAGAYMVWGVDIAPQVHLLTEEGREHSRQGEKIARDSSDPERYMRDVMRATFGNRDLLHVVPAWSRDAMELIATNYSGPQETLVRGMSAAIALGQPFGGDAQGKKGPTDGGEKVTPPKPPKKPTGGGKVLPPMFSSLPVQ
jgi:hypothetical protein